MTDISSAVTVIEQSAESGVIEWSLDGFPEDRFNRLLPVATLQVPTDLLRPVVQVVLANPDPKGGDVYQSSDTPAGHAAPTRVLLRKFATAAGISFVDERRTDDGTNPDVIEVTCVAEMLLPTGQRLRATGMKRVDLNAQKWQSDAHRAKYKSFFLEHVASRAQNRAIRALLSLRSSYPLEVYKRPFAVVSFAPNMNHPEVRSRMLDAMTGAAAQLYGPASPKQLGAGDQPINVTPANDDDPAPAPTELPGEKLAKAQPAGDLPDWAQPAAAEKPSLVEALRGSAEASGLKGDLTKPQRERLREITTGLDWNEHTVPVLERAFGEGAAQTLTAAQAQALITAADSFDSLEAFQDAWRAAAA